MFIIIKLTKLFTLLLTGTIGIATNFSHQNDPYNPDPFMACYRRDLTQNDMIVAHKTLKCRSKVFIYNFRTKRGVVATVGDRGPRRAHVDLAPAVSKKLRANGMEVVYLLPIGEQ